MRQNMKKSILLSFCLLYTYGLSACSIFQSSEEITPEYVSIEDEAQIIDATTRPSDRCGVDGIGCNDSAEINYTKTEADYRAYGERTKRDHLYTQDAAGNNITATIRPGFEDDIVTDGEFDVADNDEKFSTPDDNMVKHAKNIDGYEVICTEECGSLIDDLEDDSITSEFTEDSFDIADYVKDNGDDIEFTDYGDKSVDGEIQVAEQNITDDTVLTWDAQEGDTLRELLTKWSGLAGWKLLWNTNRNYTLSAGVMFKGKFTDVSSALIRAFARARPAPIATFYKGNRVIVVETMENENAY
jgi:hypothetical protein